MPGPPAASTGKVRDFRLNLSPWPGNLRHLTLSSSHVPLDLFRGSASTLTSLELQWAPQEPTKELSAMKGTLPQVKRLIIHIPTGSQTFNLSGALVDFVSSMPHLSSLTLTRIWPQQLEQALADLQPGQQINHLQVSLWQPPDARPHLEPAEANAVALDWEPTLRRCVRLPALGSLSRWKLALSDMDEDSSEDEDQDPGRQVSAGFFEQWPYQRVEWAQFMAEAKAAGIELVLDPLED